MAYRLTQQISGSMRGRNPIIRMEYLRCRNLIEWAGIEPVEISGRGSQVCLPDQPLSPVIRAICSR